ncbi:hypothetical protein LINGRAPRIM_LOCUS729 [Linum grandiflorum]
MDSSRGSCLVEQRGCVWEEISSKMYRSPKSCTPSLHGEGSGGHDYGSLCRWMSFHARFFKGSLCHHC